VRTGASRRLWRSAEDRLEQTGSLLSDLPGAPLRCGAPRRAHALRRGASGRLRCFF